MKDPKILIGAGVLAAFLFANKAKASTSTKKINDGNLTPEADGELGEPPGPGGKCKDGLVLKDGICQLPSVNDEDENNTGGEGGGKNTSSLVISSKCDNFTFGDGTGESWWKNKGEKIAQQWVNSDWTDSLSISQGMLKKNKEVCFVDYPKVSKIDEPENYYWELINWIREYPKIWELVWFVRNKIDEKFFDGKTTVTIDPKTMKIKYSKKFDTDLWIADVVTPFAGLLVNTEQINPGILLENPNNSKTLANVFDNVTTYVYGLLFPNLDMKLVKSRFEKGILQKDPVWKEIRSHFSEMGEVDMENA